MKKLLRTGVGLFALCAALPVIAAEPSGRRAPAFVAPPVVGPGFVAPPVVSPVFPWNGFYIGAHVGGAWVDLDETLVATPAGFQTGPLGDRERGFIYGGQIGYNWHIGRFVIGAEGQLSGADLGRSVTTAGIIGGVPFTVASSFDIDRIATLAGRLGVTFDQILVYGKFGAAWLDSSATMTATRLATTTTIATDDTDTGWMVGLGVEYALTRNWSAKVEYNFLDFGNDRSGGSGFTIDRDLNMHLVKLGINYRFGPF
jgi:outer membrane immunogenic protein